MDAEGKEAHEEMLTNVPSRLRRYANADEAIGRELDRGFVQTMLEMNADLSM